MATKRSEEPLIPLLLAIARELAFRGRFPGRDWTPLPPPAAARSPALKTDGDSILAERSRRRKRLLEAASAVRSSGASEAMPSDVAVGREIVWRSRLGRGRAGLRWPARNPASSGGDDFAPGPPVFAPVECEFLSGECSVSDGDKCLEFASSFKHGRDLFGSVRNCLHLTLEVFCHHRDMFLKGGHSQLVKCFGSREELLEHVRNVAMKLGYFISIKKSKKEKTVILGCNRGGIYRDNQNVLKENAKRKRRSILTNCPFKAIGRKMKDGLWVLKTKNDRHNHDPSKDFIPTPPIVRFSEEEILLIKEMSTAGTKPRQMLNVLKQSNPKLIVTLRDVYSIKAHLSQEDVSAGGMLETSDAQLMPLDGEIEKQVHPGFESKENSNQLYIPLVMMNVGCEDEQMEHQKMLQSSTKCFHSREELLEHARSLSMSSGYVICIKKSHRDRNVTIGCDRGGAYRSSWKITDTARKRKSYSRLIKCPFKVIGRRNTDGLWTMNIVNGEHNHEASDDMSIHPIARRCSEEDILQIKEMTFTGIQPREILAVLRQNNPKLNVKLRDIYNVKSKRYVENNFLDGLLYKT